MLFDWTKDLAGLTHTSLKLKEHTTRKGIGFTLKWGWEKRATSSLTSSLQPWCISSSANWKQRKRGEAGYVFFIIRGIHLYHGLNEVCCSLHRASQGRQRNVQRVKEVLSY